MLREIYSLNTYIKKKVRFKINYQSFQLKKLYKKEHIKSDIEKTEIADNGMKSPIQVNEQINSRRIWHRKRSKPT